MGMSGGSGPSGFGTLNEINVTPLVDVMLVLLTIFMVASSVETIQVQREHEKMVRERSSEEEQLHMLHRMERLQQQEHVLAVSQHRQHRQRASEEHLEDRIRDMEEKLLDSSQNVPVDLPKTTSEAVNLAEERKLVLTFTADRELFVGDTKVVSCKAPEFREKAVAAIPGQGAKIDEAKVEQAMFRECLGAIETKLVANVKLQEDKECYLRADRKLDYGDVLALMATIRKAGVTRFGLVAEEP
jgi:biopolymer transport protein ExbD